MSPSIARLLAPVLVLAALVGCEREQRTLAPAPSPPPGIAAVAASVPPNAPAPAALRHERNAQSLADGKRLYGWFNCSGCHAQGGGDKGPPLMDATWRYGSDPAEVFTSIAKGRPDGMPAFGGRVAEDDLWKLAAYVRSMSGLVPSDAATSRDDALQSKPAENRTEPPPLGTTSGTR